MDDTKFSGRFLHASGAYLSGANESEIRWMGETRTCFLATGETTKGRFCLIDETAKRGEAVPLHRHSEDVESFYVLEGELTFFIDSQPALKAGPESFLHVPEGTIHGFRIASERARYLILTTPRHGEFYRAISVPAGRNGLPSSYDIDWGRILEISERFGIELIGGLPVD